MTVDTAPIALVFWNPASLSYLAQLIMALVLSAAFARRLVRSPRDRSMSSPILLLTAVMTCLAGAIFCSIMRAQAGGFYASYAMPWAGPATFATLMMPWAPVFGAGAISAFIQFTYRFPAGLPGRSGEARLIGLVTVILILVEIAMAVRTNVSDLEGRIWFRPGALTIWMAAAAGWAAWVSIRQWRRVQGESSAGAGETDQQRSRRSSRNAAARDCALLMLLPLTHCAMLLLQSSGGLPRVALDVFSCWTVLAVISTLGLLYFNHLAEQSSLMFKMVTVSLAMVLAIVSGIGWVVGPAYARTFLPVEAIKAGTVLSFMPDARGDYRVDRGSVRPDAQDGPETDQRPGRVALPFDFPFYGRVYRSVFVGEGCSLGFEKPPNWIETAVGYGPQPAIFPLAIALDESRTRVSRGSDRMTFACVGRREGLGGLAWRTVLFADGRIEFRFLTLPEFPAYELFDPLGAPWFSGIVPGAGRSVEPLVRDDYLAFLEHLDRFYAPLAGLMLLSAAGVAGGLPFFLRTNLSQPLASLLGAVQRFHAGDFAARVPVRHNDEIGYLTQAFNAMASALHDLVSRLEDRVAERVEEVGRFAARNALLEERGRLAAELHDSVSQTLVSSALISDALPGRLSRDPALGLADLEKVKSLNRHALEEMRLLMTDLLSQKLAGQPLTPILSELARDFGVAQSIAVDTDLTGHAVLPADVQAMFYRVAQETLANIARHAQATHVTISFEALAEQAILRIIDNGVGFEIDATPAGHLGLQIMTYRARRAGASLDIDSRPGRGTTVTLVWLSADDL